MESVLYVMGREPYGIPVGQDTLEISIGFQISLSKKGPESPVHFRKSQARVPKLCEPLKNPVIWWPPTGKPVTEVMRSYLVHKNAFETNTKNTTENCYKNIVNVQVHSNKAHNGVEKQKRKEHLLWCKDWNRISL